MNSSSGMNMNITNMESIADDILTLATNFEEIFETLDSLNKNINSQYCWQGNSADYYQQKYNKFSENFQNISKSIASNSSLIKSIIEQYKHYQNRFK